MLLSNIKVFISKSTVTGDVQANLCYYSTSTEIGTKPRTRQIRLVVANAQLEIGGKAQFVLMYIIIITNPI